MCYQNLMQVILFLIAWTLSVLSVESGTLTFKLEKIEKFCFWHVVTTSNPNFSMEYQILEGEGLDIAFSMLDPNGKILTHETTSFARTKSQKRPKKNDLPIGNGTINFPSLKPGEYKFCFDNRIVTHDIKRISFTIPEIISQHQLQKQNALTSDDTDQMIQSVKELQSILNKVESMQEYVKGRLHRHLWTQDSTNARSQWTSLMFMIGCIACVAGEVLLIERWFKEQKHTYRI